MEGSNIYRVELEIAVAAAAAAATVHPLAVVILEIVDLVVI